jgi:hypothetical protein
VKTTLPLDEAKPEGEEQLTLFEIFYKQISEIIAVIYFIYLKISASNFKSIKFSFP